MGSQEHNRLAARIPGVLAEILGVRPADVQVHVNDRSGADFVIAAVGHEFVIEFKKGASAATVAAAADKVRKYTKRSARRVIPLVAVPFMGDVGRRLCEEAGVGWFDLSGNACIVSPGIRVIIAGRPNRYRAPGRPTNLFAPTSSRVARWLLIHPEEAFTQREIARSTGMTEGFVSRIVARLEREGYVVRDDRAAVRPRDPALLLEAWREAYQFSQHTVHQGHVAARSGDMLLKLVCDGLKEQKIEYAVTGLAAAWVFTRFAGFVLTTIYLPDDPPPALIQKLGYREEPRGANLWLVVPNDPGVFQGAVDKDGLHCVHPVQAYLDLKGHPERADAAAERLREELLKWRRDG